MTNLFAKHRDEILKTVKNQIGKKDGLPPVSSDIDLDNPVLVDINNIARWYYEKTGEDIKNIEPIDVLPWPTTWFEYNNPPVKYSHLLKKFSYNEPKAIIGVFSYHNKVNNTTTCFEFIKFKGDKLKCMGYIEIPLSEGSRTFNVIPSPHFKEALESLSRGNRSLILLEDFHVVRVAVTFCHCKNIEYYEKSHPPKLAKANAKRGNIPQETYRILDIGGLKKQAREESPVGDSGIKQALHICRGHFKTYTEENPLFGKVTGTFWCPMHKRGSAKVGTVNKDYRIKPK